MIPLTSKRHLRTSRAERDRSEVRKASNAAHRARAHGRPWRHVPTADVADVSEGWEGAIAPSNAIRRRAIPGGQPACEAIAHFLTSKAGRTAFTIASCALRQNASNMSIAHG